MEDLSEQIETFLILCAAMGWGIVAWEAKVRWLLIVPILIFAVAARNSHW